MTAKVLVHAGLGAALAVVASAVNQAVAIPWLSYQDIPFGGPMDMTRALVGLVAAAALFGALGAGLGALLGNQTAAVGVSVVWLLAVEGLVVSLASMPTLHEWLPGGALSVVSGGGAGPDTSVPLWAAAGCAVVYAGALVVAGTLRFIAATSRERRSNSRIRSRWQGKHGRNGREANSSSISPLWATVARMSRPVAAVPSPTRSSTWDSWPRAPPATADVTKPSTRLDSFLSILEHRRYQPGRRETATC